MMTSTIETTSGEALQRRRERRIMTVKGVLFAVGMVCGGYIGFTVARGGFDFSAGWPPEIAVGMAVLYVGSVLLGGWLISDSIDELEKFNHYRAAAVAGLAYMLVYPVWFLFWKAGLVMEPIHWALFLGFWISLVAATAWYRFR